MSNKDENWQDVKVRETSQEIKHEIDGILQDYQDVLTSKPGKTDIVKHEIKITSQQPIKLAPYSELLHRRDAVKREIEDLLELGIIEESNSPYAAPIVLVKKGSGDIRLCVDYSQLNRVTIPDAEPMPNQEDLFIKLSQAKIFSKLDMSRGYFQIGLEENSKHLTAFITPYVLYQYNFLSFGLVNAPATFNRMMRKLLQGRNDVISYLDDVLIFHDTWTEHI